MRIIIGVFLLFVFGESANWVMIQGVQKSAGHTPWGFVQVRHEQNSGEVIIEDGINKTPFSYLQPLVQNQSEFSLSRFRLGVRGSLDDANNINYDLLTEFAPNGINNPLGEKKSAYLTDAAITLKYLPLYVKAGKFKYPGSEEGMLALFATPFINFTTLSDQLLLERFVDSELSKPSQGVGGYRDSGVEIFQNFKLYENTGLTFAYMYGNGSGTANKNINRGEPTQYGYISFEQLFGKGKGYRVESLKFYAWLHSGKRYLLTQDAFFQRERSGLGFTYFQNGLRLEGEYAQGSGMIGNGAKDISADPLQNEWQLQTVASPDAKASGYYLATTYELTKSIELLARFDKYDRMTNNKNLYRVFETLTTGFSYKIKNYNRIDLNYAINSINAPYNSGAQNILSAVGNQLSVQFTLLLK